AGTRERAFFVPLATHFALHPDNRHLVVSLVKTAVGWQYWPSTIIQLWDMQTSRLIQMITDIQIERDALSGTVREMTFSQDGKHLAMSLGEPMYDNCGLFQSRDLLWEFADHQLQSQAVIDDTYYVAFDPDQLLMLTMGHNDRGGYTGEIQGWKLDAEQNQPVKANTGIGDGYGSSIRDLIVSQDGHTIAILLNDEVWLLDAATLEQTATLSSDYSLEALAYRPDGKQLVAVTNNALWVWDQSAESARFTDNHRVIPLANSLLKVSFNPTGTGFVVQDIGGQIHLWSIVDQTAREIYRTDGQLPNFSGDRAIFVSGKTYHIWDLVQEREILTLEGYQYPVWNGNNTLLALIKDSHQIDVWDIEHQTIKSGFISDVPVYRIQFASDSVHLLATVRQSHDSTISYILWNLSDSSRAPYTLENQTYSDAVFSPDTQYLYVTHHSETTNFGEASITDKWRLPDFNYVDSFEGEGVGFLENQHLIYSSVRDHEFIESSEAITLRDAEDLTEIGSIRYGGWVEATALYDRFSPDGTRLMTFTTSVSHCGYDYNTMKIWDTDTQQEVASTSTIYYPVIKMLPDSPLLAMTGYKSIDLWNLKTVRELPSIRAHSDKLYSLVFNSTGTLLLSNADDGTVKIWGIPKK
ncbi:MAG TPA: hypothetical protein VHL11_01705, partial [Phototrophicaceae bacterium]|nr:hypothetical protein [Phototrophicaceae bacterium]